MGATSQLSSIGIGRLVWPYRWIKWTNATLSSIVLILVASTISTLLKGDLASVYWLAAGLALLAFPGWIAWRNVDVVPSVRQPFTIASLLLCGLAALEFGTLAIVGGAASTQAREQSEGIVYGVVYVGIAVVAFVAASGVGLLRRQSIDSLGLRLEALMADLEITGGADVVRQTRPQRPLLGWTLIVVAFVILVGADFIPMGWLNVQTQARADSNIGKLAFLLLLMARAYFQPSAASLLMADPRPPVLLLRSFIDDEKIDWSRADASFVDASLESRLTGHFAHYGPFIAVGSPKESVPVIGAARAQLNDDEWQRCVRSWIDQAAIVLMMAGVTHWVDWELAQVVARGRLDRLIVCFPPMGRIRWRDRRKRNFDTDMTARLFRLRDALQGTPWGPALSLLDDASSIRSVVFRPHGRITVVRSSSRDRTAYHLAVLIAHWVMRRDAGARPTQEWQAAREASRAQRRDRWVASASGSILAAMLLAAAARTDFAAVLFPAGLGAALMALAMNPPIRERLAASRPLAIVRHIAAATTAAGVALCGFGALNFAFLTLGETLPAAWPSALAALRYPAVVGFPEAQHNLALRYLKGEGVQSNAVRGCEWAGRAARSGFGMSDVMYGACLIEGDVPPLANESAFTYLERASSRGDAAAKRLLGEAYYLGQGTAKDPARAVPYLEAAAAAGDGLSALRLGLIYDAGKDVPQQLEKAHRAFETAAKQGQAEGWRQLGLMALDGRGTPRDPAGAAACFMQAIKIGDHSSELVLASMYAEGLGVAHDPARARTLFQAARASDIEDVRKAADEALKAL